MRFPSRSSFEDHIRRLLRENRKIHAIKAVRSLTGLGLKDSKHAIDLFGDSGSWTHLAWRKIQEHFTGIKCPFRVQYTFTVHTGGTFTVAGLKEAAAIQLATLVGSAENFHTNAADLEVPF